LRIRIDLSELSDKIKLPVISVERKMVRRTKRTYQSKRLSTMSTSGHFPVKTGNGIVEVQAKGMSREEASEVFSIGCAIDQQIPEALRVAELIGRQVTKLTKREKST
jgi:endonuclease V-like protein UPF0215 family